jgi:hypothetical protein
MQPLPHPEGNGTRLPSPARRPATPAADPPRPAPPGVSRLDRITLRLGVVVATVIAVCSYAVSATSLYALGVQAGYSWWQATAVPVVADGPAIYGMFRIISRSRRGAKGAGYGWLLVGCGTAASIGGNVAHAQPGLVARAIAAAIPLAVLAMLEGLKGDAGEVTRLAAQAAAGDSAGTLEPTCQLPQAAVHLAAALGAPWLPQTFMVPVRNPGNDPDDPRRDLDWGRRPARALLDANPDVQVHHLHDPVQDRLMLEQMTYLRLKRLRFGPARPTSGSCATRWSPARLCCWLTAGNDGR